MWLILFFACLLGARGGGQHSHTFWNDCCAAGPVSEAAGSPPLYLVHNPSYAKHGQVIRRVADMLPAPARAVQ